MCSEEAPPAAKPPTTRRVYVAHNGTVEACGFTDVEPGVYEPCACYPDRAVVADVPEPLPPRITRSWVEGFAPARTHGCRRCRPAPGAAR